MKRLTSIILVGALAVAIAACGSNSSSSSSGGGGSSSQTYSASHPLKVAFMYVGEPNDGGWNQNLDNARQAAQQAFGAKVQTTYKGSVPEGPQASQVIDGLVRDGDNVIIGTSFGYHEFMARAAKQYPNVKFLQFQSTETGPNLGEFFINIAQGYYAGGMALAAAARGNSLGIIAPFAFPSILTAVNGLTLGARAIKPNATVRVVYLNSFFDPARETQAAQGLLSNGVSGIATVLDDAATGQAADRAGVPWVVDQIEKGESFGPRTYVTDVKYIFTPYFKQVIGSILDGTFRAGVYFGGWKDGATGVAPFGPAYAKLASASDRAKVAAAMRALANGTLDVYRGPIKDQTGSVRVPAGSALTPSQIQTIDWLAQGALGSAKG